ncbi:MAG TPA: hypothetical protein VEB59_16565, partial [Gemmatimonadales bacterium]|nr:hypothetical protein [Gemmatimonadales bacterium]
NPTTQWALPLLREGEVAENLGMLFGLEGLTSLALLALVLALIVLLWRRMSAVRARTMPA